MKRIEQVTNFKALPKTCCGRCTHFSRCRSCMIVAANATDRVCHWGSLFKESSESFRSSLKEKTACTS
jgi:hypothetical protein